MSRICVKNLPKYASEDRLREFFSRKGQVTDAKLMSTKDGKSRQFGFVGFRTQDEAHHAIEFFNNSFLDTRRITCQIARKIDDQDLPRPWSKHSSRKLSKGGRELNAKKGSGHQDQEKNTEINRGIDDPMLEEFLDLMKPRSSSKSWANDTIAPASLEKCNIVSKGDVKIRISEDKLNVPAANSDFNDEEGNLLSRSAKEEYQSAVHDTDINGVDQTGRLFIRNLSYTTIEEELEEHFSKYGDISDVYIVVDKETKQSKGFGYVRFSLPESAARALKELDNSIFQGRLLHVMPAKEMTSEKQQMNTSVKESSKSFKKQREEERKAAEASGNTQAWNAFYMRSDTVVEYIARKHGVSKSDFLDKEAEDLAVRIALGETQVIAETKKALTKAGVNVTSLDELAAGKSNDLKRSSHVILAKNLPYDSSESELATMFGRFVSLDKIILPQTKALALIVFLEPSEAREAFKRLRYKLYKGVPLYLEWAPSNIFVEEDTTNKTIIVEDEVKKVRLEQEVEGLMDLDIDHDRIESRSLFVKNLSFKTSDEHLKEHFSELIKGGKILSATVNKHLKNGKNVSTGFGFIEFDSVDTALIICRDLQGTVLDGHALILQLGHVKEGHTAKKVENGYSSTKLIIRNIAFEATEKDVRHLFSPFGQIKRLKLPMRFEKHRGFAFVEYVTKQEAHNAFQALANTHLYGRHLVIERAKEGESLKELRARTAAQCSEVQTGLLNSAKMTKKRKLLG